MAQTGYTPILIYSSSTTTNAPAAGNLTNSTLGSELAINITDGKLFYKDNANNVQVIAWKVTPTTAGGTGLTSYTQGDLLYYDSGTTLSKLAKSTTATRYLSNTGTSNNPAWAQIDLTNGVTGTLPVANGGTGITSLGAGVATWLGTPSSANLAAAVTDETGSGSLVFATSPTLISPTIGFSGNFTDSFLINTLSSFSVGNQCFHQFKDANGVTGAINSWGSAYGGVYSLGIALSSNMVNNSSLGGTLQYGQTGVSTMYKQYAGGHYFYRAASGSGGSNISYQEVLSTDTSNNITFTAGNLIQGTAGAGINFTANTPAAGMTSELLNWYEEGTFTPSLVPGTSGSITLTTAAAKYTRIGRAVTVTGICEVSSVSSPVGTLLLQGLPFTNSADASSRSAAAIYATGLAVTATTAIMGRIIPSESQIRIEKFAAGSASAMAGDVQTNTIIQFNLTYFV